MTRILVQGRIAAPEADRLRAHAAADWSISVWDPGRDPVEAFAPLARDADVIVGGTIPLPAWPPAPRLKLFQIPWTGYDFTSPDQMPAGVPVANTFEHETAIAEYCLLAMLEWRIGLRHMDARWRAKGWGGRQAGHKAHHGEVRGATVGVVGYGHIGHEVAARARAFGMRVIGIRRSARPCPAELDWLGGPQDLHRLLAESDFVIVACDLNAETEGLIDAAALAAMKPDGVIINVARGRVIDEDALFSALSAERIGGAVIDVWYNYNQPGQPPVWPSRHPFQGLGNVLLSAHESGLTEAMHARRWRFVAENIARAAMGETPHNIVFVGAAPAS